MAHREHNRPKKNGSYAMILFGAFLFISATLFLPRGSIEGQIAIVFGFIVGGIGFYLGFAKRKKTD
ncbi:MAG TPA: hypothetical protein VLB45_00130 [Nitrosopumilaceae archaeon]|nr:hypothetical protein [Nitrosopumilaceae archaeon]